MIKILNTAQFMDKVAPFYDEICTPCNENRLSFLKKTISKYNITNFLDLSCSTGQTIASLNKCNCNFYGIDLSKQMILVAKEKVKKYNKYKFYRSDMLKYLQHCKTYFNCIYSNSLNWLPNVETFMQLLYLSSTKLTKDGILIIDIPINATPAINNPITTHYYNKEKIIIKTSIMYKSISQNDNNLSVDVLQMYTYLKKKSHHFFIGKFSILNFTEKIFKSILETSPFNIIEKTIGYGSKNNSTLYYQFILKKN